MSLKRGERLILEKVKNSKSYYDEPILQSESFYERQDN